MDSPRTIWSLIANALFVAGAAIFFALFLVSLCFAIAGQSNWSSIVLEFGLFAICLARTKFFAEKVRRVRSLNRPDPVIGRLKTILNDGLSRASIRVGIATIVAPILVFVGLPLIYPVPLGTYVQIDAWYARADAITHAALAIGFVLILIPALRVIGFLVGHLFRQNFPRIPQ